LNDAKLKALREIGVTRLSLGVENFDDHILEINGRAHRSKEIERAYGYAKELGFPQINIDLISGMVEETEENWKDCVQKAIALDPDSITIYQMEVPYNTTIYKEMKEQGKLVAPVADWETKRRWVKEAYASLEQVGYTVGSAYTAIKDKAKTQFMYRDRLWAGADLISLGVASFGHINGVHYQNEHNFEPYMEKLQQGEAPVFRALTPTDEERLVREVILKMKLGSISVAYYQEKFGVNILEKFAAPLKTIQDWGYLTIDGDTIRLNRDGLLQVDRLIHEFFLEQHRNARYA
jgi:oxygen-independent coproporphyrinogen-3 oxidase